MRKKIFIYELVKELKAIARAFGGSFCTILQRS